MLQLKHVIYNYPYNIPNRLWQEPSSCEGGRSALVNSVRKLQPGRTERQNRTRIIVGRMTQGVLRLYSVLLALSSGKSGCCLRPRTKIGSG